MKLSADLKSFCNRLGHQFASEKLEIWAHRISALLFVGFGLWALLG